MSETHTAHHIQYVTYGTSRRTHHLGPGLAQWQTLRPVTSWQTIDLTLSLSLSLSLSLTLTLTLNLNLNLTLILTLAPELVWWYRLKVTNTVNRVRVKNDI